MFCYSYYSFEIRRIHEVVKLWKGAYCKFKEFGGVGLYKEFTNISGLGTKDNFLYNNKLCKMHFL